MPIDDVMDTLSIAASGLHGAEFRLAASAHNVAKLSTEGFQPLRVVQEEGSHGGSSSTARIERAASPAPVSLLNEVLEQMRASIQYTASAHVFVAESELRGQLTDLLA